MKRDNKNKKWVFTVRWNTVGEMASLPEIATFIKHKLANIGMLYITEVSLIRANETTCEYTFYVNLYETVTDYVAKKLLETFDLVSWKELTLEESSKWYK